VKSLAILICATTQFQYALKAQARAIKQNATLANLDGGHIVLVTDETPILGILAHYGVILGESWKIHHIPLPVSDGFARYKTNAQLLIVQMHSAAFDKARALGVEFVWTLESDVLPEPGNLRCMRDMLAFDGGYYDVAFCPYVSSGGGGIMGGRGNERNPILPNIYEDEYNLPGDLAKALNEHREKLTPNTRPSEDWNRENARLIEEVKKQPPKGNVFALNSVNWRQRGWLEAAFPGIGKGACLPSDWMPMGNNLFSSKALNLVDFTGYVGAGTQDLFLTFRRLKQNRIKICVIPHSVSSHVLRKQDGFRIITLRHEPDGEFEGHLRQDEADWFSHEPGEKAFEAQSDDFSI
jgi:hypothetical protein